MATNRTNKPAVTLAGARTKSQVTKQRAENAGIRAQTIAENQELAKSNEEFKATHGAKEQTYNDLRDSLHDYPDAVSHDTVFHDKLLSHIHELTARVNFVANHDIDENPDYSKKLGITRSSQNAVLRAMPALKVHLMAAKEQLTRSLAAHAHGAAGGASAYHTAHQALVAAHNHVADAHRHLAQTGTIGLLGTAALGNTDRLMSESHLSENLSGYEQELQKSAVNKRVDVPSTILKPAKPNLSMQGEFSEVGKAALRRKNLPATPEEAAEKEEASRALARQIAMKNFREAAMSGRHTPTLAEMQRNEQLLMYDKGDPKTIGKAKPNPYAGVGITGLAQVKQAVANHYTRTTGKSFRGSGLEGHSQESLVNLARTHYEENKDVLRNSNGRRVAAPNLKNMKSVTAYLNTHAKDELFQSHPAVQYAMQHNLGVLENPETTIKTTLSRMGETKLAGHAERILKDRFANVLDDPTNSKEEADKLAQRAPEITTTPPAPTTEGQLETVRANVAAAKESRSLVFSNAVNGGN